MDMIKINRTFIKDTIRKEINFRLSDQNKGVPMLACGAIHAGTCAVAAYDQEAVDALLGLDGEDQFTVYLAPVGKY